MKCLTAQDNFKNKNLRKLTQGGVDMTMIYDELNALEGEEKTYIGVNPLSYVTLNCDR